MRGKASPTLRLWLTHSGWGSDRQLHRDRWMRPMTMPCWFRWSSRPKRRPGKSTYDVGRRDISPQVTWQSPLEVSRWVTATVPQRPISQGPIHLQRPSVRRDRSCVRSYTHAMTVPDSGAVCQACPGTCTRTKEIGRSLAIGPHDAVLRRHRAWMSTPAAREVVQAEKAT